MSKGLMFWFVRTVKIHEDRRKLVRGIVNLLLVWTVVFLILAFTIIAEPSEPYDIVISEADYRAISLGE